MNFSELFFGNSDAKNEFDNDKDRFISSFVDHEDVLARVKTDKCFLILGRKGAGKTALSLYLTYKWPDIYNIIDVNNIKISEMSKVHTDKKAESGYERSVTAWKFTILMQIINESLASEILNDSDKSKFESIVESAQIGGFDLEDLRSSLSKTTQKTVKFPLGEPLFMNQSVNYIEKAILETLTERKLRLILDGLDNISINDSGYIESMTGLIEAVDTLNSKFRKNNSFPRILVMMRSDIFSKINHPNAAKIQNDWGFEFDWNLRSIDNIENASLFKMVNKKVGLVGVQDVCDLYLPKFVKGNIAIRNQILNHTRYTPRDILTLLEHVQRVHKSSTNNSEKVQESTFNEGLKRYCDTYFERAIKDELIGVENSEDYGEDIVYALEHMRKPRFSTDDFIRSYEDYHEQKLNRKNASKALEYLYTAGAFSYISPNDIEKLNYSYRGVPNFNRSAIYSMHSALRQKWSLRFEDVTK